MWSSDSGRNKDAESAATFQDIGAVLRQARESQGMTCDQLAGALNMGTEQLEALESGDLQRLPEPVFVTAMTRRVASKLNVDCDPLIQRLQTALANPDKRKTSETDASPNIRSTPQTVTNPRQRWGRWITASIGVAAVAGGAMVLASQRRTPQTTSIPSTPQTRPTTAAVSSSESDIEQETSTAPAAITITSSEPSWLSIRNSDGSELFEGTLADSKTLPADADVEIYAGRPDLVLISRGDQTPKALGTIEQVRWYKLNP